MYVCAHAIHSLKNSNVYVWVGGGNQGVVFGRGVAWMLRFRPGLLDELLIFSGFKGQSAVITVQKKKVRIIW